MLNALRVKVVKSKSEIVFHRLVHSDNCKISLKTKEKSRKIKFKFVPKNLFNSYFWSGVL